MKTKNAIQYLTMTLLAMMAFALAASAAAPQHSAVQSFGELKESMEESQAKLRLYEWIETTVVSLNGEEKSRRQERCYYGADGGLQRVAIGGAPPQNEKRGLRGRIAANAREAMTDYMRGAAALAKTYVPPDPARIQASIDTGSVSMDLLEGSRVRLIIRDYLKRGDQLSIEMDRENRRPLRMSVATDMVDTNDEVTMDVRLAQLSDGTTYTSGITLEAKAKNLTMHIENSGHRRLQ